MCNKNKNVRMAPNLCIHDVCGFVLVIHISVWSGLAEVEYDEEREMAISRRYVARTVGGFPRGVSYTFCTYSCFRLYNAHAHAVSGSPPMDRVIKYD